MMLDTRLPQPNDSFRMGASRGPGPALVCRALEPLAPHLFTTRAWTLGSRSAETGGRRGAEVARAIRADRTMLVRAHQVHRNGVSSFRARDRQGAASPKATSSSRRSDFAIAIQTADCVPLLIADRRTGAVAAAHAGWRGLAANVPRVTIDALAREFGSRPEDLIAVAGPSVGACCYEVGADVRHCFEAAGFSGGALERLVPHEPAADPRNPSMPGLPAARRPEHWFFDGWTAVGEELEAAGVPAAADSSRGAVHGQSP